MERGRERERTVKTTKVSAQTKWLDPFERSRIALARAVFGSFGGRQRKRTRAMQDRPSALYVKVNVVRLWKYEQS